MKKNDDSEITDFIYILGHAAVHEKLECIYQNRTMFEEILQEMSKHGHRRTCLKSKIATKEANQRSD